MSAAIMLFILTLILFVRKRGVGGDSQASPDSGETDLSADTRLRRLGRAALLRTS